MANLLAMDRTTLTAALKPLERRGLLVITADPKDRRARVPSLTDAGRAVLAQALPIWTREHAKLDEDLAGRSEHLRAGLKAIA